jgi:hypothetical protein
MFDNMDQLITYINANASFGVKMHYARAADYYDDLYALAQAQPTRYSFPVLGDEDFSPYVFLPLPDSYWSGYFTSRPALKRDVRLTDQFLAVTEILFSLARAKDPQALQPFLDDLIAARRNSSILMHHDAITGTAEQPVVDNYEQMLATTRNLGAAILTVGVDVLLASANTSATQHCLAGLLAVSEWVPLPASEEPYILALFNPSLQPRTSALTLPLSSPSAAISAILTLPSQQPLPFQLFAGQLYFTASLAPSQLTTFWVQPAATPHSLSESSTTATSPLFNPAIPSAAASRNTAATVLTISNPWLEVAVCPTNWTICWIFDKTTGQNHSVVQEFLFYRPLEDSAYVFRPRGTARSLLSATAIRTAAVTVTDPAQAPVAQIINVTYGTTFRLSYAIELLQAATDISQSLRLRVELTAPENHEIVMRFTLPALNGTRTLVTDDSGMQLENRPYRTDKTIAGNYHPATTTVQMTANNLTLSLVSDQTHGVGAPGAGALEVMIHRRMSSPGLPPLGLPTPLNDTSVARHLFILSISATAQAELQRQASNLELNHRFAALVLLQPHNSTPASFLTERSCLPAVTAMAALPANIELMSLNMVETTPSATVVRLHHTFQADVDTSPLPWLTQPQIVNISALMRPPFALTSCSNPQLLSLQGDATSYSPLAWPTDQNVTITARATTTLAPPLYEIQPLHFLSLICKLAFSP